MVMNEDGLYDKLFTIETTTSDDAMQDFQDPDLTDINKFEKSSADIWYMSKILNRDENERLEGMPENFKVQFSDRDCMNKIMRAVYLVYRSAYVVIWYYFMPFLAMILQFMRI